jgi:uncharacterized protein YtpQ (UPF0354 family)
MNAPDPTTLLPRIKVPAFVDALEKMAIPKDSRPVVEGFAGDLLVAYAFDVGNSFTFLTQGHLREMGLDVDRVRTQALNNLRQRLSEGVGFQSVLGSIHGVQTDPDLTACVMLLDEVWDAFAENVSGDLVAAVPRREVVLVGAERDTDKLRLILEGEALARQSEPDPHTLSLELFVRRARRWQVLKRS